MDFGKIALDAAKGAAAGSVVPGIGTGLGAAGAVVLDLAPELGRWLFGADAAATVAEVRDAVQSATGTTAPAEQVAALADPAIAAKLRVDLAGIAAAREAARDQSVQAGLVAALADVADARKQTAGLAGSGSRIAWGAAIVSALLLAGWIAVMIAGFFGAPPLNADDAATLRNLAVGVAGYWLGSSAGSARKTDLLATREGVAAPAA